MAPAWMLLFQLIRVHQCSWCCNGDRRESGQTLGPVDEFTVLSSEGHRQLRCDPPFHSAVTLHPPRNHHQSAPLGHHHGGRMAYNCIVKVRRYRAAVFSLFSLRPSSGFGHCAWRLFCDLCFRSSCASPCVSPRVIAGRGSSSP